MQASSNIPTPPQLIEAWRKISGQIHRTPLHSSRLLNEATGRSMQFKCENFQKTGSFKIRGVSHVLQNMEPGMLQRGIATHSSGNHAQAVAYAASLKRIPAYIVMPEDASPPKIEAVTGYGASIYFCGPTIEDREHKIKEVLSATGANFIPPYDHPQIIAGQASATLELLEDYGPKQPDLILVPVGGGGLSSGALLAATSAKEGPEVIGVEPQQADDALDSLRKGSIQPARNKSTVADGLKTSLGELPFSIIQSRITDIATVSESAIIEAMQLIWARMKLVVEPSGAVPLAALLEQKIPDRYRHIALICSGGNLDLNHLPWQDSGSKPRNS